MRWGLQRHCTRLPTWTIVEAASKYFVASTVNEAEYESTLLGFELLECLEKQRLVICGEFFCTIDASRDQV